MEIFHSDCRSSQRNPEDPDGESVTAFFPIRCRHQNFASRAPWLLLQVPEPWQSSLGVCGCPRIWDLFCGVAVLVCCLCGFLHPPSPHGHFGSSIAPTRTLLKIGFHPSETELKARPVLVPPAAAAAAFFLNPPPPPASL